MVQALTAAFEAEGSCFGETAATEAELQAHLGPYFWVAEADGAVIGFAYGTVKTSEGMAVIPAGQRYIEVDELYVLPAHRDGGVGGRLLDALLEQASADGVERSFIYSASRDWRRVTDFYGRHGYQMWFVGMYKGQG
ncbi:MAG: GNAT family N-acetyltransferase [Mycobacterium leprae]